MTPPRPRRCSASSPPPGSAEPSRTFGLVVGIEVALAAVGAAVLARRHSAHAVLTGLLDRSALYGVLAEIEGLGLDVLEGCQLTRAANHQDQVTPAHRDGR